MSKLEIILIIILTIVLIAWLSAISYFIVRIYINKNESGIGESGKNSMNGNIDVDINSPFQTDFFNKSAQHAEKVLFGKAFIQEYGESNYYGNRLMDVIGKLNDDTKKYIVVSIKYMSVEPSMARNNENAFRLMAEQERVPVWFVILREATKKVVPEFLSDQAIQKDNIIPLYQQTG